MSERLGALDASFLYLETPTTAMHVGGVATFAVPAGGTDKNRRPATRHDVGKHRKADTDPGPG